MNLRKPTRIGRPSQHDHESANPVISRLSATKSFIKTACLALLISTVCWLSPAAEVQAAPVMSPILAGLPPGNAVTDGAALLRYSLPIDNKEIRKVQGELEGISEWLRSKRWGPIKKDLKKVEKLLDRKRDAILASVPEGRQPQAAALIDSLITDLDPMRAAIEAEDKEAVWTERKHMLDQVGEIEELMVQGFPFEVPEEYSSLPQLKGRATVEFETTKGKVTVIADGYSAPVTAGNFIDFVNKGFYNEMPFIRAEDFYVLQTGDPEGPEEGYIDPKTKEYRAIPMEILVKGDDEPIYGFTLEEIGQYMDEPILPFNSYGSLALARPGDDNNGGSSQFFYFLFEAELTPAGRNMLDGRYAVFGYTIDGKEVLRSLTQADKIISAKVTEGLSNLDLPSA